jgi:5-methylcytosine-specific restriction endonuclease McrA
MSGNRRRGTGLPRVGTKEHKQRIGERDNWICGLCGWFIIPTLSVYDTSEGKWAAVIDHIVPRCIGGNHEDENLQIAHYQCNWIKSIADRRALRHMRRARDGRAAVGALAKH